MELNKITEIPEDPLLLDEMIQAQREAGYTPSSHWKSQEDRNIVMLKQTRLSKILSLPNSFGNFPNKVWRPFFPLTRAIRYIRNRIIFSC